MSESLICLMIREDFGDKFADVVGLFLKHGELNLQDFVNESALPYEEAKHILIILIKHNIVTFHTKAVAQQAETDEIVYHVSPMDVLHRLRLPRMRLHVEKLFGDLCSVIFDDFIDNGRLRLSMCIALIREHIKEQEMNTMKSEYTDEEIMEAVGALIKGQFLVQVQTLELQNELNKELGAEQMEDVFSKRKGLQMRGKSKKKMKGQKDDSVNMLNNQGLSKDILSRLGQVKTILGQPSVRKESLEKSEKMIEEVKTDELSKTHPLFYDSKAGSEHMLRINFRKFIHDFRKESVVEIVSKQIAPQAGLIVQFMLTNSHLFSRAKEFNSTVNIEEPYTLNEIMSFMGPHPLLSEETVSRYLQELIKEKYYCMVKKVTISRAIIPCFTVDMNNLIHKVQIKTLEQIIDKRFEQYHAQKYQEDEKKEDQEKVQMKKEYNHYHARIFRLLDHIGFLDEKQISETCLIPMKEARACISELFTHKYIDIQDVPGKQGQVYCVRPLQAINNLVDEMYKTLFNLKKRSSIENQKWATFKETNADEDKCIETESKILKFEYAILELDESILLFNEY